jgi:hypothetical protein
VQVGEQRLGWTGLVKGREGKTTIGGDAWFWEGAIILHLKELGYGIEDRIYLAQHRCL